MLMLVVKLRPFLWFCNFPLSLPKASDEHELLVESALEILQQLGLVQKGVWHHHPKKDPMVR